MRVRVSLVDPSPPTPEHLPRSEVAAPGEPVSIGRSPAATLCVPGDEALDDEHLLVVCYDRACRAFDVSGRGLIVDGAHADEALVGLGSVVRAGASVAHIEGVADEAADDAGEPVTPFDDVLPRPHVAAVGDVLRRAPGRLYVIIDAARQAPGMVCARRARELMAAIPADVDELDYADAAPYLVRLAPESTLLGRLLAASWGHAECTFLTSTRPFAEVRAFLRDLMDARLEDGTPDGDRVLFRFYDPTVLARILSRPDLDVAALFGPVGAWFVEAPPDPSTGVGPGEAASVNVLGSTGDGEPGDALWMEAPPAQSAPGPAPRALWEFRAQRVLRSAGPSFTPQPTGNSVRVFAKHRVHHLFSTDGTG